MNEVQRSDSTASSRKADPALSASLAARAEDAESWRPSAWARAASKPAFIAFLLALAAEVASVALRLDRGPAEAPLAGLFWTLALLTTLTGLARRLPTQNVVASAAIIMGCAAVLGWVNTRTDVPFGRRSYTQGLEGLGPQLPGGLPAVLPLMWVVFLVNSRGVARLIMRPWRKTTAYGYWVVGLTGALTGVLDLGLQVFAGQFKHYWLWEIRMRDSWEAVALSVNYFAATAFAICLTAFCTPWLINKQPVKQSTDYHSLVVWSLLALLQTAGAVMVAAWWSAGICVGTTLLAGTLAIRGARW